jgi:hypothetical protein
MSSAEMRFTQVISAIEIVAFHLKYECAFLANCLQILRRLSDSLSESLNLGSGYSDTQKLNKSSPAFQVFSEDTMFLTLPGEIPEKS